MADVVGVQRPKERHVLRAVLRPDRTQQHARAVPLDALLELRGVRLDREPRHAGLARRRDDDPRIERHDTALVGEQRIDVELGDFRDVGDEIGNARQRLADRPHVGGGEVAIAGEQLRDPRASDDVRGEDGVERRQPDDAIPDHLDRLAACAEQDDRAEHRIGRDADDQFVRIGTPDHALHGEAGKRRIRTRAAYALAHRPRRRHHRLVALEIERDAADVRLVRDLG